MRIIALLLLIGCDAKPPTDDTDATAGETDDTTPSDDSEVADDSEVEITPHDCLDNHGIFGLTSRWTYT
jgi:hypothetical protein